MIKFQILKIISFLLTKYLYLKCISRFLSTFPLGFNPGFGEDCSYFRIKKAMSLVNGWCDAICENLVNKEFFFFLSVFPMLSFRIK